METKTDKKINFEAMYYVQVGKTEAAVRTLKATTRIFRNTNKTIKRITHALNITAASLVDECKTNVNVAEAVTSLAAALEESLDSMEKTNEELLQLTAELNGAPEDEESETVYVVK